MPALASILFGAALTIASAYALGSLALRKLAPPPEITLAVGATLLSVAVFFIVLAGVAAWPVFLTLGLVAVVGAFLKGGARSASIPQPLAPGPWPLLFVFAAYAVWYFINALTPETLPDGLGYHLGLPYQYLRLGGFPARFQFFDLVPQGMEMLYTMAFAFGRHSAAKLVEFAFLMATPSLMLRTGRRLGLTGAALWVAPVFYFAAPVAGITGSSSYTDAAMVFFTLAAFYALLEWRASSHSLWLAAAGLAAGFCYAVKLPGAIVVAGSALFLLVTRRGVVRPLLILGAGASLVMLPWLIRNAILTGDPLAPLGNQFFPNPYFHLLTERELGAALASYGHVPTLRIPWELAFGDGFVGTFGPLLLLLPVGLLALRRPEGRLTLVAAAILALPWFTNRGARFLMPAVAMAAFPLAMVLPRRIAWAAVAVQAALCWPQALNLWQPEWVFRLHGFPLRAALRIEPEDRYIPAHSPEYPVARMVERATPPGARIFSFDMVANAYLARDVVVSWQSAQGDSMTDTLRLASVYTDALFAWSAEWPATDLRALRFRLPSGSSKATEWDISDIELYAGAARVSPGRQWDLRAWPNVWEAPLALDGNLATRWRTWQPIRAGMYFEIDFDPPTALTRAVLLSHTPVFQVPLEVYGKTFTGSWQLLSASPAADRLPAEALHLQAASALRRAGFQYLLTPTGQGGNGPVGREIDTDPLAWDMVKVGQQGDEVLFRLR